MTRFMRWSTCTALLMLLCSGASAAFDLAAIQKGAHVAVEVCNGCHSLKYLKYGDLLKIGMTKSEIDLMRNDKKMSEPLIAQLAPENALAMFGTVPPDLSLMASAREGGAHYIQEMLTGFYVDSAGNINNHAFPGIKMPDILGIAQADPASRKEIESKARNVSEFLDWAADPHAETRQRIGYGVLLYVAVLTLLFYLLKNKIWTRIARAQHVL